jgi:FkbM family methyltransferase
MIQRKIAYFGIWEPNLTAYIRRTLRPGDVFVDVGANIGYYSLLAASLVRSTGAVVAIEASPQICALLQKNIELNAVPNVRVVNCAAAYDAGEIPVYAAKSDNIGQTSTMPRGGNIYAGTVQALPLQNILTESEALGARIIKIDVEGAEPPILRSILENLNRYSPNCEVAAEISVDNEDVLAFMRRHGFNAYIMENDYSDGAYIRRVECVPVRFEGALTAQADFIFSREDRSYL